jgi:hypothetical protein
VTMLHFSQRQIDGQACIWCGEPSRQMIPCGQMGEHTLMRCWPDCADQLLPGKEVITESTI